MSLTDPAEKVLRPVRPSCLVRPQSAVHCLPFNIHFMLVIGSGMEADQRMGADFSAQVPLESTKTFNARACGGDLEAQLRLVVAVTSGGLVGL